jgi:hypothetical protein
LSAGTALAGPPIDNAELAKQLHQSAAWAQWIDAFVGTHARHFSIDLATGQTRGSLADLGQTAGSRALAAAGLDANWRPKHENLAELAADLNVGIDSFVFADDSPYECGLVRRQLPDVTVIQLDNEPALHVSKLLRDGWFDVRELTATDRTRASKYRDELVRKDFLHTFDSLDDYLRELEMSESLIATGCPHQGSQPRSGLLTEHEHGRCRLLD